jgi:hypothetical protein
LSISDLVHAREALRIREGIGLKKTAAEYIGSWKTAATPRGPAKPIASWADKLGLDAVVWTALPPRYGNENRVPTVDEVVAHLSSLPREKRGIAERYVRMTPRQIDTEYRRAIERELGWTPTGEI